MSSWWEFPVPSVGGGSASNCCALSEEKYSVWYCVVSFTQLLDPTPGLLAKPLTYCAFQELAHQSAPRFATSCARWIGGLHVGFDKDADHGTGRICAARRRPKVIVVPRRRGVSCHRSSAFTVSFHGD